MEDLNDIIEDEEKAEKLSKIIDRKVKERLEKEREKKRRRKSNSENRDEQISRRSFLKKLGIGAAGLGALSLTPVSALDVKDSHGFQVYDNTDTNFFDVNPGGPVEVKNTDLQIKGSTVVHGGNQGSFNVSNFSGSNGSSGQVLQTDGSTLSWSSVQADKSDDSRLYFGTDNDFGLRFDSSSDVFAIDDNTNSADRLEVDRTTGNLKINGELTENASI